MNRTLICVLIFSCLVGFTYAGLLQRIQQLAKRQKNNYQMPVLGQRKLSTTTTTTTTTTSPSTTTVETSTQEIAVVQKQVASTTPTPSKANSPLKLITGAKGLCEETILLDLNSRKQQTYTSALFPLNWSSPYFCSWDVKIAKTCRRGRVTFQVNPGSRLVDDTQCKKGYIRISPFMKEAKVCGKLADLPPFTWVVDGENRNQEVNIIMKNIGMNDALPEGLSFHLTGECLDNTIKSDVPSTIQNVELNSKWLVNSAGIPGVVVYSPVPIEITSKLSSKISHHPAEPTTVSVGMANQLAEVAAALSSSDSKDGSDSTTSTVQPSTESSTIISTTSTIQPTTTSGSKNYVSRISDIFRRFKIF